MSHGAGRGFLPDTDAVIIGGGIAGLYAGYRLLQASVPFLLLEAADHAGGRVFSRPEHDSHLGLVLDEGANLINSTDKLALHLMDWFGIAYVRRLQPGAEPMHYLLNGTEYDQPAMDRLLFSESGDAIRRIQDDRAAWRDDPERQLNPRYVDEAIASYLDRCGAGPILRTLLQSFFWSEYGHTLDDLNVNVLFDYLAIDPDGRGFKLIPNVDEAYTVPGGTGQIAARLEAACRPHIVYGLRVLRIEQQQEGIIRVVAVDRSGVATARTARQIIFAAPLHDLNGIEVSVAGLTHEAIRQARGTSYASGTKLHLKFRPGFKEAYRYTGILLTDSGEQIWPSSVGQGAAGLLTVLTGPLPPGRDATIEHAGRVLQALARMHPQLPELYVGVERTDAPMSYSGSFRPGEAAHLAINDGAPAWVTIGEASGDELQGYLEGALRSADKGVARLLLRRRLRRHVERDSPVPHADDRDHGPVASEG